MHETIGQSQIYPISIVDMNNDHFDLIIDESIKNWTLSHLGMQAKLDVLCILKSEFQMYSGFVESVVPSGHICGYSNVPFFWEWLHIYC